VLRILIADDEEIIRKGLRKMLSSYGNFSVVGCVSNGYEVLDFIETNGPTDCVISDVRMPVMDGVELVRRLSADYPSVKAVMLSGFDDFQYVRDTLRMGAVNYLLKPVEEAMLVDTLCDIEAELAHSEDKSDLSGTAKDDAGVHSKVEFTKKYILEHYREDLNLTGIANATYMNASYLSNLFKRKTGLSVVEYLTQVRLDKAKELLKATEMSANEIANDVGYADQSYFSRLFKKNTGMTPIEYRHMER